MNKLTIIAAVSLIALVGCKKSDQVNEPSGAQQDQAVLTNKDLLNQQKKQVEDSASQAKDNISDSAKAQKASIDADAKASKASLDAQAAKADADSKKITESAGASIQSGINTIAGAQDQGTTDADRDIVRQIRTSSTGIQSVAFNDLTIISDNGNVTLKGTVKTDSEKMDLETKAKNTAGVKAVDNQLKVKP